MTAKTVDVLVAQTHLLELLSSVAAGSEIVITQDDTPVARLLPMAGSGGPRVPGLHPGAMVMSPDFNEPLPDDFWAASA